MPTPLRTPRINNNDDSLRLSQVLVTVGAAVRAGDPVAEVETDKATFSVEAEQDGYVLGICGNPGDVVEVGSVLFWMGENPDERIPVEGITATAAAPALAPTLKAALLLAQYGLDAASVPAAGSRLGVADVETYVTGNHLKPVIGEAEPLPPAAAVRPLAAGRLARLTPEERGMLRTVLWHRDEAVPGHIEVRYDPAPWAEYAQTFQKHHNLLLNPLLALMAWKLVELARQQPNLNATIVDGQKYIYDQVNLGFTVQSGSTLYLAVVKGADKLSARGFVDRLTELQRGAMKNALQPHESSGGTLAFSSMARWKVSRHVPILPPHNSLIVAHTAPFGAEAFLGATYDHRVLSGGEVVQVLQALGAPPPDTGL